MSCKIKRGTSWSTQVDNHSNIFVAYTVVQYYCTYISND